MFKQFIDTALRLAKPAPEQPTEPQSEGVHYRDILGVQREMVRALTHMGYVVSEVRVFKRNWYAHVACQGWLPVNDLIHCRRTDPVDFTMPRH